MALLTVISSHWICCVDRRWFTLHTHPLCAPYDRFCAGAFLHNAVAISAIVAYAHNAHTSMSIFSTTIRYMISSIICDHKIVRFSFLCCKMNLFYRSVIMRMSIQWFILDLFFHHFYVALLVFFIVICTLLLINAMWYAHFLVFTTPFSPDWKYL